MALGRKLLNRLVERPPRLYRLLFPGGEWRLTERSGGAPRIYLSFDDGPVPEATPWVLDTLARYGLKATFFMVGDNARRYPELVQRVRQEGHSVGNHTMHHLQGLRTSTAEYIADIHEADRYIGPTKLFRPPHGLLRRSQCRRIVADGRRLILYDLVTRDYARKITPGDVLDNVRSLARPGAVIVFHDSVKSIDKLHSALPAAIEWLLSQGYEISPLPMD